MATALAARGIAAIVEPLIQIHYHSHEAVDLDGVQAVLCTSANGVRALARASGKRGVRLFAVGDATAGRALAEGFDVVESAGGNVGDLARLTAARLRPQDGRLLHVAGGAAAGDLGGALRAQGFSVDRCVLYEARAAAALSPAAVDALRIRALDFALFFSPRTASIFVKLAGSAGVAAYCERVTAVSISRAADTAVAALNWRRRRIAERPSQPALLDALDRAVGELSGD